MLASITNAARFFLARALALLAPYWHPFMGGVHRALDPVCGATADVDSHFGVPPCTSAKFLLIAVLHVLMFAFLWSRTDAKAARVAPQHSVLRYAEDEPLPTTAAAAGPPRAAGGAGLSSATGLRRR